MNTLESKFNEVSLLLENLAIDQKLKIVANLLFSDYPDYKKLDTLYKQIDKPDLKLLNNYRELEDTYHFSKDSYVYNILNCAHDLLSISSSIEMNIRDS